MPDIDPYKATTEELIEEVIRLQAEVARLRHQEALKDIAEGDVRTLKDNLNNERLKVARLRDSLDGMSTDMSLMEDRIAELSGRRGMTPDYE